VLRICNLVNAWRPLRLCESHRLSDSLNPNSTENFKNVWLVLFPVGGELLWILEIQAEFWDEASVEVTALSTRLKEEVAELRAKHYEEMARLRTQVEVQREDLMALQKRTKTSQLLLAKWKGLRKKIRNSLPRKRKSLLTGQQIVGDLETSLSLLRRDLEGLIASIPSEWPTKGWLSSRFGRRQSPWTKKMEFHNGLDIANRRGTPVYASGDGVVKFAGLSNGSGKSVVINHGQGITTLYGHLSKIHVKKGERVKKNQKIANVGSTGKSTNPHLHYEVRIGGTPIDPRRHLLRQKTPSS